LGVDLFAVSFGERLAQQSTMLLEDFRIPAVAEALEKHGGPFDVGKEESYRSGRQVFQKRLPRYRARSIRGDVRRAAAALLE
jgi:hypothetical protein